MFSLNIPTSIAELRAAIGTEYQAASEGIHTEIHRFLDWAEGKAAKLAEAKTLLEANGFEVTVHVAATPPAAT